MKLSASVPDELWAAAAPGETSTSQVVQQALEALVEHRKASAQRVSAAEARHRAGYDVDSDDEPDVLARLETEARHLQRVGYMIGVDLADRLGWLALENLPLNLLARNLLAWAGGDLEDLGGILGDSYANITDTLHSLMHEYGDGINEDGEPITSLVLYEAVVAGMDDVRTAIMDRLRDQNRNA